MPAPSATALDCHGPEAALQAVEPTELLGSVDLNARRFVRFMILILTAAGLVIPAAPAQAQPKLMIQPLTWNVVGLDSNDANVGPTTSRLGRGRLTPWLGTCSALMLGIHFKWCLSRCCT